MAHSLLDSDELRELLSSLEYEIPKVSVLAAYELTDEPDVPCVVYQELNHRPRDVVTTSDGRLRRATYDVSYQITAFAKDCKTTSGKVIPRDMATRSLVTTICDGMFDRYSLLNDDMSDSYAYDNTSNTQSVRFSGVIDDNDYIYNS